MQDWFLKFELKTIPNVAEVASVGGVVKQYQIQVNPLKLAQYGISLADVKQALGSSNQEAGGSSVEMAEAEYMVRASGYLQTIDDFNNIVLKTSENGVPVYLRDVARVQTGPEMRRGIAELNGQGEVAGGVVILRSGKNAREVITAVKDKLETLKASLPEGVEIVTTYDRSQLIDRAIDNLSYKLLEEFIVVAIVCALFLWHVRSALVAIISLPLGLCIAFIVMHFQGLNANIMSLGGIAIAVGAMVDAAIVMIENAHKRLEEWDHQHPSEQIDNATRWKVITNASVEVGPALFISLLIIYPQDYRNSPQALKEMPILTPMKQQITLGDVADIRVVSGPTMLKTENARPTSWIYIDARGRDMVSVVNDLKSAISQNVKLGPGTSVSFSGQFELLEHANKKLKLMVPMTVMIIFILLYLAFRRVDEALLILMSLPFALIGGIWFLYWQGFHMSVATGTGFIALAGVAAEFGVVMLMYLRHAIEANPALSRRETFTAQALDEALYHGAVLRVRPKAMTVAVIIAGLLPILWGTGTGSEVMSQIAAPMIGGMITAPLLSLFIIPAAYKLIWLRRYKKQ